MSLKFNNVEPILRFGFLVILANLCRAKRYDLPPGWTANNTRQQLRQIELPKSGGSYRILEASFDAGIGPQQITSDNGTFALAFFDRKNTGDFSLCVVMQSRSKSGATAAAVAAVPIWTANRNQSVGENASLFLTPTNGKLLLLDPRNNYQPPIWAPPISFGAIAGMELTESGNFCLYDTGGSTIWQSFDDPQEILLPYQNLKQGMRLESSSVSGLIRYSAAIDDSQGLILSSSRPPVIPPQPYHIWKLAAADCSAGFEAALILTETQIQLGFEKSHRLDRPAVSSDCADARVSIPLKNRMILPFLKLNLDGDLVAYGFHSENDSWVPEFEFSSLRHDSCKLPNACGPYGICGFGGGCRCVQQGEHGGAEVYRAAPQVEPCGLTLPRGVPRGLPQPDECQVHYVNHHLLNVSGASHFSIPFLNAARKMKSIEGCADSCRWNCSCAAAFFDNRTGDCFFVLYELLGSLTIDSERSKSITAMLKFKNMQLLTGRQEADLQQNGRSSGSRSGKRKKVIAIAAGTGAGVLGICLGICAIAASRRQLGFGGSACRKDSEELEIDEFLSGGQGLPQRFSYAALDYATNGFSKKLGTGGFGSVYEGSLSDGRSVAVKKLEGNGAQGARQFVAEVATIGSISHVNVVKLCGFCVEGAHRLLVYEFMPNGSLDRWLFLDPNRSPDQRGLSWGRRVEIALGTARGLAYLHEECREAIIHLDVKPQNILLDDRFVAKVGDFGMSKLLADRDVSQVMTCVRGTPGYLAPEWLLHSIATKKCDVYSYGMVLLEIIGGRKNLEVSRMNSDLAWYFPAWVVNEVRQGKLMEIVDAKIRVSANEKEALRLIRIALWCIQENPGIRPTMPEIVQMIEGHRDVEEPPMSFHFAVQAIVDFTASRDCVSMGYVSPPSFDVSSLIR